MRRLILRRAPACLLNSGGMSMYATALAWTLHIANPAPAPAPGGLGGLLPPSGGLVHVDGRALALENDLLALINQRRAQIKQTPLQGDERLRTFARTQAEAAANGTTTLAQAEAAVQAQNLAPLGHRLQFAYGSSAASVFAGLKEGVKTFVESDLTRLGVGAFVVADKPVAFQLLVLGVQDPDPMMGKSGLNAAQTDPVLHGAEKPLQACYNASLRNNPNLRGDLLLELRIDANGHVSAAKLLRGLHVERLDACLLGVAAGLNFPEPYKGKPVTLLHPMRLIPPQGDRRLGILSNEQVQSGFKMAQEDFHTCYAARLKEQPKLAGTITLQGIVAPDGSVKNIEVLHSDASDAPLQVCVLNRAKQLHFAAPAQGGEVDITYPLRFGL